MDWADLRIFLAIAQTGSLRRAADLLGVAQPTVSRHLQRLESDLGLRLFDRAQDGHRLTKDGEELLPGIRDVENAVDRVQQQTLRISQARPETVCVGAGETAAAILARGLHILSDGLRVELILTDRPDLIRDRKPDIMITHGLPREGEGQVRRVGTVENAIYGLPKFAESQALPLTDEALSVLPWLGFTRQQDHYVTTAWLTRVMRGRAPSARLMNSDLMVAAAKRGAGVAVLPTFKGDDCPELMRLTGLIAPLSAEYWVKIPKHIGRNPSIRAVMAWIIDCFRRDVG